VSRRRLGVVVPVVVVAVALAAAASAFAATRAHTANPQKTYGVSATLKGTGSVSGRFSATFATTGSSGKLTWKLSLTPGGPATSVQIRAGAASVVLCKPCSTGAHGVKSIAGAALKAIVGGTARLTIQPTKGAALNGTLKASATGGGGGTITVTPTPALIAKGKALVENYSCAGCHTIDGTKSTGPTWKGLAGSTQHLTTGGTAVATDTYLVGVITDPSTLKVAGYDAGVMAEVIPPGHISQAEAEAIVAYIKTLK